MRWLSRILPLAILAFLGVDAFSQAPPPVPALPDTSRLTSYTLSASTCACSVGFNLYGDGTDIDNWVHVWIAPSVGATATKYLSTDPTFGWTLTSVTGSIGTIPRPITDAVLTFNNAQTGVVTILGAQRPRRLTEFSESRGVPARDHNQALNSIFSELRENWDRVSGAILGQPGETLSRMPSASSRANQVLVFDGSGNPTTSAIATTIPVGGPGATTPGHPATWCSTFGTLICDTAVLGVPVGGTGNSTLSAHGVLLGEGTSAIGTATIGTAGRILIDQGAGADPMFVAPSGAFTITSGGVATLNPSTLSFTSAGTGATARTYNAKLADVVNVRDFGAVADGNVNSRSVSITNATAALTVTGGTFTAADCNTGGGCTGPANKVIAVTGAGAAGATLVTTITNYTSATQVTLAANAGTTLSASTQTVSYGTDDTTAIQNAWTYAASVGSNVSLSGVGTGIYFISALTAPTPSTGGFGNRAGLQGAGDGQTQLISTVSGTSCAITMTATYGTNGDYNTTTGPFLLTSAYGTSNQGYGLCPTNVTNATFDHVYFSSFTDCVKAVDSIRLLWLHAHFNACGTSVQANFASQSYPNQWTFIDPEIWFGVTDGFVFSNPADLVIIGGDYENNGIGNATWVTIDIVGNPLNGSKGLSLFGGYFSGNNGAEDILINDGASTYNGVHTIEGAEFQRISSTVFVTNSINIGNSGTGLTTVNIRGNGFQGFNSYTPNAARPYIGFVSGTSSNYILNTGGNYFGSSTEYPVSRFVTEVPAVTYTASPSCGTATITTNSAHFQMLSAKKTFVQAEFTITAIGTCTTGFLFNLPNTSNLGAAFAAQEVFNTGKGAVCSVRGAAQTTASCARSDITSWAVNDHFYVSGVYENQ